MAKRGRPKGSKNKPQTIQYYVITLYERTEEGDQFKDVVEYFYDTRNNALKRLNTTKVGKGQIAYLCNQHRTFIGVKRNL